jgi:histidinol phosphatase-like enzyme (inositol monophosphatase family)
MASPADDPIKTRLDFALKMAQEAGDLTLRYFRSTTLQVDRKSDDSPVTIADREAEKLLRARITSSFPEDSILGEEFGFLEGNSGFQWVLDPIDGTKSFIHGVPLYTTLISVLEGEDSRLGVIHSPATAETVYAAVGGGCWYTRDKHLRSEPAYVSKIERLNESLLLTSEVQSFAKRSLAALEAYLKLQSTARLARTWGDGYGYLMIATGRADVMIDPVMNLWDAAPLQPVIEEAGGTFSDWQGRRTIHSGEAIASNGLVSPEVLATVRGL